MSAREKVAGLFPSRSLGESVADEILAEHRAEVLREAADEVQRRGARLEGTVAQATALAVADLLRDLADTSTTQET